MLDADMLGQGCFHVVLTYLHSVHLSSFVELFLDGRESASAFLPARVAVSERVLNHIRLDGRESLRELCKTEFSVAIQVEPSHDCRQLRFHRLVPHTFQKSTNRSFVDDLEVLVVYRFERPSNAELRELL